MFYVLLGDGHLGHKPGLLTCRNVGRQFMFSLIYDQNSIYKVFFIYLSTLFTIATLKMARNEQINQNNVRSDCMFQLLYIGFLSYILHFIHKNSNNVIKIEVVFFDQLPVSVSYKVNKIDFMPFIR